MKNLTEFRLYVWTDGKENRARLDFQVKPEARKSEYLNGDKSGIASLSHVSVYFIASTFVDFCKGEIRSYSDLNMHLHDTGTSVTFYDMDLLAIHKASGVLEVPFFKMYMPIRVRKILLRMCERLWAKDREDAKTNQYRDRIRVDVSDATLARWEKTYQCGAGKVKTMLGYDEQKTAEALAERATDKSLDKNLKRLETIAANQTYSPYQTATVHLAKRPHDKEFWFEVLYRKRLDTGERINACVPGCRGGLVYHTHAQEWATHT